VPDERDRFADLGGERPRDAEPPRDPAETEGGKSAAERFQELDERDPEPKPRQPRGPARPGGRYGWVVGIAFIVVVIVAGANALRNSGEGYRGVPEGELIPPFAAPLAVGGPDDNDANIAPDKACDVKLPGVFNVCEARAKQPLVLTFVANASRGCEDQLDRIQGIKREFPGVAFVGVISRRDGEEAEKIVRANDWDFPIVYDRDAQLFNLYGIGDCPTTVFARRGGVANRSLLGKLDAARLRSELNQIR
jgi:peroxiredoxin